MKGKQPLRLGVDVGSTTVKTVILDIEKNKVLYTRYERHHAEQAKTVQRLLQEIVTLFPNELFRVAVCGSGGKPIAERIGAHYIQEVVANAAAVRKLYPQTRTAIELGGQDAKVIFFHYDEKEQQLITSDMRMNGSCAGGTGAFIDEVAAILQIASDEFETLAAQGRMVHAISGRCGVFAKTDIQTILNNGGSKADIALSAFHAIAKQTIGGLAQGLELKAPIIFEGGPLTYNPTLIRVFAERLELQPEDIIIPEHADTIVARGAAIALDELFPLTDGDAGGVSLVEAIQSLYVPIVAAELEQRIPTAKYFASEEDCVLWREAHKAPEVVQPDLHDGDILPV